MGRGNQGTARARWAYANVLLCMQRNEEALEQCSRCVGHSREGAGRTAPVDGRLDAGPAHRHSESLDEALRRMSS